MAMLKIYTDFSEINTLIERYTNRINKNMENLKAKGTKLEYQRGSEKLKAIDERAVNKLRTKFFRPGSNEVTASLYVQTLESILQSKYTTVTYQRKVSAARRQAIRAHMKNLGIKAKLSVKELDEMAELFADMDVYNPDWSSDDQDYVETITNLGYTDGFVDELRDELTRRGKLG